MSQLEDRKNSTPSLGGIKTRTTPDAVSISPSLTEKQVPGPVKENAEYPTGLKLGLILTSVLMCTFLAQLDRLIIVTAIPRISDHFHSVNDIGWYGSSYLLLQCSSQLLYGKMYTFFSVKWTFLTALFLFELGSAVCGSAPSSIAFIIGRAIAGLGAAGIQSGTIVAIVHSVPLHKRSTYQGLFGAIFGVTSVVGPLLGGALTTKATWRWCFYINLPLGGLAAVAVYLLLKVADQESAKLPLKQKLAQLDLLGTMAIVPGMVCLVIALQWGGSTYAWRSARIIVLLVLAGLLFVGFILVQTFLPKTATIPPRIVKQRSIISGSFSTICNGAHLMIFAYYLPVWFQGIQGASAIESGIRFLPTMLSMVVGSVSSGILIRRVGYYTPFLIVGVCFMAIGSGLLYTLQVDSSSPKWIGYQIIYGLGGGLGIQAPNLAAQTTLPKQDVPMGISLLLFCQLLGGAIFVPVGQNVLSNQLVHRLSSIQGINPETILDTGATALTDLSESIKPIVKAAYNDSLRQVYLIGVILACVSILGAASLEWRSMKKDAQQKGKTTNSVEKSP
ncbi:putative HC-toxin efflux carrier TOXA 13 [Colletotrichum chlorophyti]|uniref:Putative HC-toxin efflux carrier TOXA 13 n=1 Tax=Colletotrichum chlorophyti TaxID=708187 RepID=A0A1Q8RPI3_9PEZI|nr:putative HC-toxin efflux carrier TOXA 13 [Colletotrichum chlorophyti]